MTALDLLSWRAAPTTSGPRTAASDGERSKATSREHWDAFARAHLDVATAILQRAQEAEGRISAKALAEWARATFKVALNNTATAGMAEWLVESAPDLASRIERRRRR